MTNEFYEESLVCGKTVDKVDKLAGKMIVINEQGNLNRYLNFLTKAGSQ